MRQSTPNILDNVLSGATPAPPESARPAIALTAIVNDGGTQMRAGMDTGTVLEYEEAIKAASGAWPFPAVVVYHDGAKYWLADGFHRVNAAHRAGLTSVPAEVRAGTRRDAILHAAGANASHGLRRTNADKRRAVETLLRDEEWQRWSNVEIARRCAVAESSVRNIRAELESTSQIAKSFERIGADGRTTNTENIGSNRPARLSDGDLTTIVQTWMMGFWRRPWPENPSHTNGTLWQELTAWMHENVRETWQEGQLKEVIKRLHYAHVEQWKAPTKPAPDAPAPATARGGFLTVAALEATVRAQVPQVYGAQPQTLTPKDMRTGAQMRAGRLWLACTQALVLQQFRLPDLTAAINNVADEVQATLAQPQPAPAAPAAAVTEPAAQPDRPLPDWAQEEAEPLQQRKDARADTLARLAQRLIDMIGVVGALAGEYGDMTGDFHTAREVEHGLEKMQRAVRRNMGLDESNE